MFAIWLLLDAVCVWEARSHDDMGSRMVACQTDPGSVCFKILISDVFPNRCIACQSQNSDVEDNIKTCHSSSASHLLLVESSMSFHGTQSSPPVHHVFFPLALLCLSECFRRDGVQRVTACKVWAASLIRSQLPPMSTCNKILWGRFGHRLEAPDIALPWWWFEIIKPTIRIKKEDGHHDIMIIWYMICLPYTVYHIKCVSDVLVTVQEAIFCCPEAKILLRRFSSPKIADMFTEFYSCSQQSNVIYIYNIYPLREWWNFPCWEH